MAMRVGCECLEHRKTGRQARFHVEHSATGEEPAGLEIAESQRIAAAFGEPGDEAPAEFRRRARKRRKIPVVVDRHHIEVPGEHDRAAAGPPHERQKTAFSRAVAGNRQEMNVCGMVAEVAVAAKLDGEVAGKLDFAVTPGHAHPADRVSAHRREDASSWARLMRRAAI